MFYFILIPILALIGYWITVDFEDIVVSIGSGIAFLGEILDYTIQVQNDLINAPVVQIAWTIIRDFVNIFFILILVVIAFATILGVEKYSARSLLAKLIIAALLINFSLVIGQFIVNALYIPANMFIGAISESQTGISAKIANAAQLNKISRTFQNNNPGTAGKLILTIMTGLIFIAFGFGVIMFVVRIPIILFLLVISPLTWILYALPIKIGKKDEAKNLYGFWWSRLFKWSIFPTIFFGGIYFSLLFATEAGKMLNAQASQRSITGIGLSLQEVALYAISIAMLWGSFQLANKMGGVGGKWLYGLGAGALGLAWTSTAIPGRAKRTWSRIKEEGIPRVGYGGARGLRKREAKPGLLERAAGLPVLSRDIAKQREMLENVNKEISFIKDLPKDELKKIAKSTTPRGIAAKIQLAESQPIEADEFAQTLKDLGANSIIAKRYYDAAEKNKFNGMDVKKLKEMAGAFGAYSSFSSPEYEAVRIKLYDHIKDKVELEAGYTDFAFINKAVGRDSATGKEIAILPPNKRFEFIKEIGSKRPDLMAYFEMENKKAEAIEKGLPIPTKTTVEYMEERIKKANIQKLVEDTDIKAWQNPDFVTALKNVAATDSDFKNKLLGVRGITQDKKIIIDTISYRVSRPIKIITADIKPENIIDLRNTDKNG